MWRPSEGREELAGDLRGDLSAGSSFTAAARPGSASERSGSWTAAARVGSFTGLDRPPVGPGGLARALPLEACTTPRLAWLHLERRSRRC